MALEEYRRKRKFSRTPEPEPKKAEKAQGRQFVVQKHHASHLHYDFRLELEGVLKSWAVPKGPTLAPAEKRLAMMVEDHPLDYMHFEGIIPEGNYGAGTVMVWDTGTYQTVAGTDPVASLNKGDLKFILNGKKLKGEFALVHMRSRRPGSKGNEWLLIKKKDAYAQAGWDAGNHDWSVLSGRSLDQIAADEASSTWESGRGRPRSQDEPPVDPSKLPGAVKAEMPETVTPMLAALVEEPEDSADWLFEIKWDGVRALAFINDGQARLQSRSLRDMTACYPDLTGMATSLRARRAIVDGEIVSLDDEGRPSFERLQQRMNVVPDERLMRRYPVIYYVFDLLYLDGYDLRRVPLEQRKETLRGVLLPPNGDSRVRFSDHQIGEGAALARIAAEKGLEGIVGKRRDSLYAGRRSRDWQKVKTRQELECLAGGYTEPRRSRKYFGALILGLYRDGKLAHVGNAGSGFTQAAQEAVWEKLKRLRTEHNPFASRPPTLERPHWVKPELRVRVKFTEWTKDHKMRAPVIVEVRDREGAAEPLFSGSGDTQQIEVEGRRMRIQHLNKIFFPEGGYTKRDVIEYYCRIAPFLLPHMHDKPVTMKRYPDGIHGGFFFQKDAGEAMPDWVRTVRLRSGHGHTDYIDYVICNDTATLVYLANLGCIDQNLAMSRADTFLNPDFVLFDLDPGPQASFEMVVEVAQAVREQLDALKLAGYPKTSGATGMHIYVPLAPRYSYEQSRDLAELVFRLAFPRMTRLVTQERSLRRRRKDRVYLDFLQNGPGKTVPPPYSLRPRPGAPVSTPLRWEEVKRGLDPSEFNIRTIWKRLDKVGDLFAGTLEKPQRLEPALERLRQMLDRENRKSRKIA